MATTDDLAEGATNKYFSSALCRSSFTASPPLLYSSSTGALSAQAATDSQDGFLTWTDHAALTTAGVLAAAATAANSVNTIVKRDSNGDFNAGVVTGNSGIRLNTTGTQPTCSSTTRGMLWMGMGALGIQDIVQVCRKNTLNAYAWATIL